MKNNVKRMKLSLNLFEKKEERKNIEDDNIKNAVIKSKKRIKLF